MRHDEIIKSYAEKLGMGYLFENWTMANVKVDKRDVTFPLLIDVLPASGKVNVSAGVYRDAPKCLFAFLAPAERHDYDGSTNESTVEEMKQLALKFIALVNTSGDFEPVDGDVDYSVVYDKLDRDLTGVSIELELMPIEGECETSYID